MTGQLFSVMITLLCMGSLLTTITWYLADSNYAELSVPLPQKREKPGQLCKQCKKVFDKVKQLYNKTWQKNEENYQKFRTQLSANCSGFDTAIITQINTPRGAQLDYGDKRIQTVTIDLFHRLIKEHPFLNKTWDTCSVVGNGGILANSRCGEMIDSAELVIRCNLAPLSSRYEKHVGSKTYLVTMNPSILREKYNLLNDHRRPFVEKLHNYGSVLLLLPVSPTSMKVLYTLEDFEMPTRVVYYNPTYLHKLAIFWRSHGLKSQRVSTGLIMVSIALEVCSNVHIYGFWPFNYHPYSLQALTHHYYDNMLPKPFHAMPVEFDLLLRLHSQGVLRLHLGECKPGEQ